MTNEDIQKKNIDFEMTSFYHGKIEDILDKPKSWTLYLLYILVALFGCFCGACLGLWFFMLIY
jgi:hypothetical protein